MSRTNIRLTLLGGFALRNGDDDVPLAPNARRLLALLALHETGLRRDYVAGLLWADSTEARASGSLRSVLCKLPVTSQAILWNHGGSLGLCAGIDVDVRRATRIARSVVTGCVDEEMIAALLEPGFCCELLPGWYDEWVLVEREWHRQLTLHALESLCEHLTAVGRYGCAVLAGLAAVEREPLRESAHRALMRAHIAEGNVWEAIQRYRYFERIAARELGVDPSPLMRSLIAELPVT